MFTTIQIMDNVTNLGMLPNCCKKNYVVCMLVCFAFLFVFVFFGVVWLLFICILSSIEKIKGPMKMFFG